MEQDSPQQYSDGKRQVRTVAVVATGVIGASWTSYFLARGLQVSATDPSPDAESRLRETVARHWPALERMGLAPGASPDRLRFSADLAESLDGCDFVQENGPEREDFKIDLFRRMDALLPADVILATSSSGLLMSRVQSGCQHPERVVLGHPFNPPHLIPLVEVIGGERTSPETIERSLTFYRAIGKRAIHARKEVKGHIANRLQAALWREAFYLVDQGVATVSDIDTAIAYGPGLRWALLGPFMNLSLSGGAGGMAHLLEHLGPPIESWWRDLGDPSMTPELCRRVVEGTAEEIGNADLATIEKARDALLLQLLAAKAASPDLP